MATLEQIKQIAPSNKNIDQSLVNHINEAMGKFNITTPKQQAMFLAQCSVESGGFKHMSENLNYSSAERIRAVFRVHFAPTNNKPEASLYVNNPEKLGNHVYANRFGNGDVKSGDGFKFRGGGFIQLTFRSNWVACANEAGMMVEELVTKARTHEGATLTAAWFWSNNSLNKFADRDDIDGCSTAINGRGIRAESLIERRKAWEVAKKAFRI